MAFFVIKIIIVIGLALGAYSVLYALLSSKLMKDEDTNQDNGWSDEDDWSQF